MANIWKFDAEPHAEVQAERLAWFDKIAPKGNWKLPIDAVIRDEELRDCNEAAIWFAGCSLQVVERLNEGQVRVTAPGYYAAVGA